REGWLVRAFANRVFLDTLVGHGGAGVAVSMEGEQEPIIIIDESRFDFVLHGVGLAVELGAHVSDLDRLSLFILPLVGDLAGLRLPLPRMRNLEKSRDFPIPGVADRLNFIP